MELRPEEITKIIRSQIKNYENKLQTSETGTVILSGDGIAKVSGLDKCMAGELVEFPNGAYGMAQNLEEDTASIVCRGGHEFTFLATTAAASDFPVSIQLKADGKTVTVLPDRVVVGGESVSFENGCFSLDRKACYGNGHEALIEDFYACIADGVHFAIDGEEGAKVIRLILAAYQSEGNPIRIENK